jgi:hypothetical protein
LLERSRIRCPVCRSAVPIAAVWATGDHCPRCLEPLDTTGPKNGEPVRPELMRDPNSGAGKRGGYTGLSSGSA